MKKGETGQALVEMALVLPLFFMLLFAVGQMAIIGYDYLSVQNAASAGANTAISGGTDAQVTQAVDNAAPTLSPSLLDITLTTPRQSQQPMTIHVSYPVTLILSVVPGIPNPLIVSAQLTMQVQ